MYPAWAFQPRLIAYLGYDPFTDPTLGSPKGNETSALPFLSPDAPVPIGQKIRHFRLKSRKTRQQLATEWGISAKTLWGWETGQREPSPLLKKRIDVCLMRVAALECCPTRARRASKIVNNLVFLRSIAVLSACRFLRQRQPEAFERYVGGKCLRVGRGEAWRDIKAWIVALPRIVDVLHFPSVSEPFLA